MSQLEAVAKAMVAPGKGILAADESSPTIKKRFDAIGRYRDRDTTGEIDCSGELPDGRRLAGLADLKRVIRSDPAFVRAVAHKLFVYGIGREPRPVDLLKLDYEVGRLLEGGKVTLTDLILKIVDSDAFRLRAVEKEQ